MNTHHNTIIPSRSNLNHHPLQLDLIPLSSASTSTSAGVMDLHQSGEQQQQQLDQQQHTQTQTQVETHLLPSGDPQQQQQTLKKTLSLTNATSLVIGTMIGSGIFASPGIILKYTRYPGLSLLLWMLCGLLSMFGALTYAELALTLPSSGGEMEYLKHGFSSPSSMTSNPANLGSLFSFLFIWTSALITRPASVAIISLVFGQYLFQAFYYLAHPVPDDDDGIDSRAVALARSAVVEDNLVASKSLAILCIVMVSLMNSYSVSASARAQDILSTIKTATLILICFSALVYAGFMRKGHPENISWDSLISAINSTSDSDGKDTISKLSMVGVLIALQSGLFAFDGWNTLAYASEELENPEILLTATKIAVPLVIVLYVLVNVSYFSVLDLALVANTEVIGFEFAVEVLGDFGAVVMSLSVAISAFGAAHGTLFGGSRVVYAAGRDRLLPSYFGLIHPLTSTPIRAIVFQTILSILILLPGNFEDLIDYFSCGAWTFYFLTSLAFIRLRYLEPDIDRPYRSNLSNAILFMLSSFMLLATSIVLTPSLSAVAFGFMALGVPLWYAFVVKGISLKDLFCVCRKKDHQILASDEVDEDGVALS